MSATVLRAALLGAVDGVITSFAIVAGANALAETTVTVAVIGTSSLVADGLSMGVSEYISSASERALVSPPSTLPSAATLGAVCFLSFVVCGALPLVVFLVTNGSLLVCSSSTILELMGLAFARARVTKEASWIALTQTTLLGVLAGGAALGVGVLAAHFTA